MRRTLVEMLDASAEHWPTRAAVVDSKGESIVYAELKRQADALAGFLSSSGVRRGDRVGILVPKSIPAIVAIFGAMKAGATYVALDPSAPVERDKKILADCRVRALVIDTRFGAVLAGAGDTRELCALVALGEQTERITSPTTITRWDDALRTRATTTVPPEPEDLAYLCYTSGSTGVPKGVMITHANVATFLDWYSSVFDPQPLDRFSGIAPLHFDGMVIEIFFAIKHGASVHLISEETARNPARLAEFIAERQLTIWFSAPTALTFLAHYGNLGSYDASSLRIVMFGGEVFPVKHLRALQRQWPHPAYYNVYGPTETTVACLMAPVPTPVPDDREEPYPIGFPAPYCGTLVLDEQGHVVAPGAEGLLYVSGPSIFAGYWNRPSENSSAFIERDGVRWYNTGDLVCWNPEHGFFYSGRKDRMVKRRGFRIELDEIERALYQHPQVAEAAVISITDAKAGLRIVAFLALRGDERPSLIELKSFCSTKLPAYMTPDRFELQQCLPRTSATKLDYQALLRQL